MRYQFGRALAKLSKSLLNVAIFAGFVSSAFAVNDISSARSQGDLSILRVWRHLPSSVELIEIMEYQRGEVPAYMGLLGDLFGQSGVGYWSANEGAAGLYWRGPNMKAAYRLPVKSGGTEEMGDGQSYRARQRFYVAREHSMRGWEVMHAVRTTGHVFKDGAKQSLNKFELQVDDDAIAFDLVQVEPSLPPEGFAIVQLPSESIGRHLITEILRSEESGKFFAIEKQIDEQLNPLPSKLLELDPASQEIREHAIVSTDEEFVGSRQMQSYQLEGATLRVPRSYLDPEAELVFADGAATKLQKLDRSESADFRALAEAGFDLTSRYGSAKSISACAFLTALAAK